MQQFTYINSFTGETLHTDKTPVSHKGYLIYPRPLGPAYDIVKNGVCVSQVGSIAFAMARVDVFIANNEAWQPHEGISCS